MFSNPQMLGQHVVTQYPELGAGWRVQKASLTMGELRASPSEIVHRAKVLRLGGQGGGQRTLDKAIEEATVQLEPPDHCVFVQMIRGPFSVLATVPFMYDAENPQHWHMEQTSEIRIERFQSMLLAHARFGAGKNGRGSIGTPEHLSQLLADLRHWCDANGVDTAELFDKSYEQFMQERHSGLKQQPLQVSEAHEVKSIHQLS